MTGYVKGTTAAAEIEKIRAAYSRAAVAVQALAPADPTRAFADMTRLGSLAAQMNTEAARFRQWLAAYMYDLYNLSYADLGRHLGVSKTLAAQLVAAGRQKEGNPVTDPGTDPLSQPIVAMILTDAGRVLVEHRPDKVPEWTFPVAEIQPGESPAAALARRIPEEIGVRVIPGWVIGQRLHPRTGRHTLYMSGGIAGDPASAAPTGDPDLDAVRWVPLDGLGELMADMFPGVRAYLEGLPG